MEAHLVWITRSRQFRLVTVAGAAVLLAAGCSAAGGAGAKSAGTGRASGSTQATLTAAEAVNLAATHAQQATSFAGTFSMRATGGSLAMAMSGTMSETTRPSLLSEANFPTVSVRGMPIAGGVSEIMTSSAIYLRMSTISTVTGKPWMEVPLNGLKVAGVNLGQIIQQVAGNSPLTQTEMLAHASDVRKVGTAIVGGVPVTEYSGSYSLRAALSQLHGVSTSQIKQELASDGFTTADFQIWLDDQQQVRKLIVTEHGSHGNIELEAVVTSIDQPVRVQLPSASEVAMIPASALNSVG
jgi:hypothetical protein